MYPKMAIESHSIISFTFEDRQNLFVLLLTKAIYDCFPSISTDLDDDTRIVRAGRTGKAEDDVVFYMVRDASLYD